MKTIFDLTTCASVFTLMMGFCMIERNPVLSFLLLLLSATWIAFSICFYEENDKNHRR